MEKFLSFFSPGCFAFFSSSLKVYSLLLLLSSQAVNTPTVFFPPSSTATSLSLFVARLATNKSFAPSPSRGLLPLFPRPQESEHPPRKQQAFFLFSEEKRSPAARVCRGFLSAPSPLSARSHGPPFPHNPNIDILSDQGDGAGFPRSSPPYLPYSPEKGVSFSFPLWDASRLRQFPPLKGWEEIGNPPFSLFVQKRSRLPPDYCPPPRD